MCRYMYMGTCVYGYVCADVCVRVWVCQYTYAGAKGECQVLCFITLDLVLLRQNPSLSLLLGIQQAPVALLPIPQKVLVFQAYMAMPALLNEFCGSQPGIPCLCSKSSQPMGLFFFTSFQKEKVNYETKNLQVEFQWGQQGGSKHLPTIYLFSKQFNSFKDLGQKLSRDIKLPNNRGNLCLVDVMLSAQHAAGCDEYIWKGGPHLAGLVQILSMDYSPEGTARTGSLGAPGKVEASGSSFSCSEDCTWDEQDLKFTSRCHFPFLPIFSPVSLALSLSDFLSQEAVQSILRIFLPP